MSKFLDKDGLAYLWERIQELVATCGGGDNCCPLYVHFTQNNGVWSADRTVAEISSAITDGRIVKGLYRYSDTYSVYDLAFINGDSTVGGAEFTHSVVGATGNNSYLNVSGLKLFPSGQVDAYYYQGQYQP